MADPRLIYLDYHATTPVDPRVVAVMVDAMTRAFGNPRSADHRFGDEARDCIERARAEVARLVGCGPEDVRFTTSATAAVRRGLERAVSRVARAERRAARIAALAVEHRAVLDALAAAERAGRAEITWLAVDAAGRLDMASFEEALRRPVDVVCAMAANNEVGNVYPTAAIARLARAAGATVFVDGTQAVGHRPLDVRGDGVTWLTLSGHKLHGPKGVGALVTIDEPARGDDGDDGDAGTPNVPGIVGLGEACRLRRLEMADDEPRVASLRDRLERALRDAVRGLVVNGDREHRLSGNLHVSVAGVPNDAVIARMRDRLAISTGAACSSGAQAPSHVLRAMRLPEDLQESALRIGLGKFTTERDVDEAAAILIGAIHDVRAVLGAGDG